jgi:ubiquinone/menaquinone biosynthesis C-methylase UbiE
MLTVDYGRLGVRRGMRVLDLGCGEGRHSFEAYRRGADVVAVDWNAKDLATTREWCAAIRAAGEAPTSASATAVRADLCALPFPDASFDRVIAAEVL